MGNSGIKGCCESKTEGAPRDLVKFTEAPASELAAATHKRLYRRTSQIGLGEVSSVGKAAGKSDKIFDMPYPMYVMPVKEALALTEMKPHQDLLEEGKVVEYKEGMEVMFVSHQWAGLSHPDPDFSQFTPLQMMLKGFADGSAPCFVCALTAMLFGQTAPKHMTKENGKHLAEEGYIWYDFFSVPQIKARSVHQEVGTELQKAVNSIPAYIETCQHFIVLTPPLAHADLKHTVDYSSWASRGWCRMELISQVIAAHKTPIIRVMANGMAVEAFGFEWIYKGPRTGNFSVEDDRAKVEHLMSEALAAKLKSLGDAGPGEIFDFRFFSAIRAHMDLTHTYEASLPRWLETFGFAGGEADTGVDGWGPMHLAALEGNAAILKALVARGCKVDAPTTAKRPDLFATKGLTPLQVAAMYVTDPACCVKTCEALLDLGADPRYRTEEEGWTVLQCACIRPDGSACKLLLERGALPDLETPSTGDYPATTPLVWASSPYPAGLNLEALQLLLAHGADATYKDPSGMPPLIYALMAGAGSVGVIKALCAAGADPNDQVGKGVTAADLEATRKFRELHNFEAVVGPVKFVGLSPLHFAAAFARSIEIVEALLEGGADPSLPCGEGNMFIPAGTTALDLAKMNGDAAIEQALSKAMPRQKDCC